MAKKEFNQIEYQNKMRNEKYERFEVLAPKGTKERAAEAAAGRGLYNKRGLPNVSEYVLQLIEADLAGAEADFSRCMNPPEE